MAAFLAAVRFLTVVPTPGRAMEPGKAVAFFPTIGALIGALGAGILLLAQRALPMPIAALITVAFWTAISGVLHEDGLADVADAIRAGRSREKMLAILKDSRIGTFGAVALILSVLARWQALEYLATPHVVRALVASQTVSRAGMVALAWISRPAGEGLGFAFTSTLTTTGSLLAIAQGVAAAMWCGWRPGLGILAGAIVIVGIARGWFYRRIGGVNGDCFGFTEQILEIFVLTLFTCGSCVA